MFLCSHGGIGMEHVGGGGRGIVVEFWNVLDPFLDLVAVFLDCFFWGGRGTGMHWKRGRLPPPPPPSRAPGLCPATVPLTASASLNGVCNRPQPLWQPPPTACLTAPGAASEARSLLMLLWGGQFNNTNRRPEAQRRTQRRSGESPPAHSAAELRRNGSEATGRRGGQMQWECRLHGIATFDPFFLGGGGS